MKKQMMFQNMFSLQLLLAPLLFLPGCFQQDADESQAGVTTTVSGDAKTGIDDGSPALLKINGRTVITMDSLDKEFDRLLQESPQLQQVLPFMPEAKGNFFQGMVAQEMVDEYISRNNIDTSPAYVKEYEDTIKQVTRMLNNKYFSEKHPAEVSEAEVRKFYEENKDKLPDLMVSQGGVQAEGVSFASEEEAKAFLAKAKEEPKATLEKLATDAELADSFRDFNMVNGQSLGIDPALRTKIMSIKQVPRDELFNAGDQWWVVRATEKKEPEYRPFEPIKQSLEEYLKKQKQMEMFEKAIDKYKDEFDVEINDELLKPAEPAQAPAMPTQIETDVDVQDASSADEPADVVPAAQTA